MLLLVVVYLIENADLLLLGVFRDTLLSMSLIYFLFFFFFCENGRYVLR